MPIVNLLKDLVDEDVKEFFNRKTLKKILMTTKYNIGFESALVYFKDELNYINDKERYRLIIKNFSKIFNMLKKDEIETNIFYKNSLNEFNKTIVKFDYIELEDIAVNLIYNKLKKREICIFYNKQRHTLIHYEITNDKDFKQIELAALPHTIHSLDALYARKIFNYL